MSHFLKNWKLVEPVEPGIEKEWYDFASQWYPASHPQDDSFTAGIPVKHSPVGLVLSGGGAKGAYQAGVWKAMVKTGVAERVKAISGTSAGAINAAAFAMVRNPDKIESFWHNGVNQIVTPNFTALSPLKVLEAVDAFADGKPFPLHGLLDCDALKSLLNDALKGRRPLSGGPAIYATSLECRGGSFSEFERSSYRKISFRLDEEQPQETRVEKILASCAIPLCFSPVEIDGKRYVDGGWDEMGGENIPLSPILKNHKDLSTIVVVRCNSKNIEPEPLNIPHSLKANIVEIRPKKPLPGLFDIENLGGGLLMGALIPGLPLGIPALVTAAIAGFFSTNRAKAWGAALAYSSLFTTRFFEQGYADGLEAFQNELSW